MDQSTGAPVLWAPPETEQIEWQFNLAGATAQWDWSEGGPDLRTVGPARKVSSGTFSRHVRVLAYSVVMGDFVHLESGLEHDLLRELDSDPEMDLFVAQPFCLMWSGRRRTYRRHVPDLLARDRAGRVTVWDVKVAGRVNRPQFVESAHVTRTACTRRGWSYKVFTGHPPVVRHNLLWLQAYRIRPEWAEDYEGDLLRLAETARPLGDLLRSADLAGRTVIWHLIWARRLKLDITKRLGPLTEVVAV